MKITGKGFGDRILAEYVRHTGEEPDEVRAREWYALLCQQHPKSVLRWTQSDEVTAGPHLSLLLLVEVQVGGVEWCADPAKLEGWARARRKAIQPRRARKLVPT